MMKTTFCCIAALLLQFPLVGQAQETAELKRLYDFAYVDDDEYPSFTSFICELQTNLSFKSRAYSEYCRLLRWEFLNLVNHADHGLLADSDNVRNENAESEWDRLSGQIQMRELKSLYDTLSLYDYYTKSFVEFQIQYEDPSYRDKVFDVVSRDGLFTKSRDEFDQKFGRPFQLELYREQFHSGDCFEFAFKRDCSTSFEDFKRICDGIDVNTFYSWIDKIDLGWISALHEAQAFEKNDSLDKYGKYSLLRLWNKARREYEEIDYAELVSSYSIYLDGRIWNLDDDRQESEQKKHERLSVLDESSIDFDLNMYATQAYLFRFFEEYQQLLTLEGFKERIRYPAFMSMDSVAFDSVANKWYAPFTVSPTYLKVETSTDYDLDPIVLRLAEAEAAIDLEDVKGALDILEFFPNDTLVNWIGSEVNIDKGEIQIGRKGLAQIIERKMALYYHMEDWGGLILLFASLDSMVRAKCAPHSFMEFWHKFLPWHYQVTYLQMFFRASVELNVNSSDSLFCELAREAMIHFSYWQTEKDADWFLNFTKDYCQD